MKRAIVATLCVLVGAVGVSRADIVYPDFSNLTGLQLNGNAAQDGTGLAVTPNAADQVGTVFSTTKFPVNADFTSTFDFQFEPNGATNGGADGLLLIIHNDPRGTGALGSTGGPRGYLSVAGGNVAIVNSVAVGLWTWTNDLLTIYTNNDPSAAEGTARLAEG